MNELSYGTEVMTDILDRSHFNSLQVTSMGSSCTIYSLYFEASNKEEQEINKLLTTIPADTLNTELDRLIEQM